MQATSDTTNVVMFTMKSADRAYFHKCGSAECYAHTVNEYCKAHTAMHNKKKCAKEGCSSLTMRTYCCPHAPRNYKLNPCKYESCQKMCRGDLCGNHTAAAIERKRQYYHDHKKQVKASIVAVTDDQSVL
jgi:hypothetical protein